MAQRYDPDGEGRMQESGRGEYVLSDDYDALEDELFAQIEYWKDRYETKNNTLDAVVEEIANLYHKVS